MSSFTTALTAMTTGDDWTQTTILNQLIAAIRNRDYMLNSVYSIALVASGDDIQSATWIRSLQNWVETYYTSFCQPASTGTVNQPEYTTNAFPDYTLATFAAAAGLNTSASTAAELWTRKAPSVDTFGAMTTGDYIGYWIWTELAAALQAMTLVRDTSTPTFFDVGDSWLADEPSEYYESARTDDVKHMGWSFLTYYLPITSAKRTSIMEDCVENYDESGVQLAQPLEYPAIPWGAPDSDSVWACSGAALWNGTTTNEMYGWDEAWAANLSNCYKGISHSNAMLWPGADNPTRKIFIDAFAPTNGELLVFWGIPQDIDNTYSEFAGGSNFYRPPPSSRGGGDAPLTELQEGWNAIYSAEEDLTAESAITRSIADRFSDSFPTSGFPSSAPLSIDDGAKSRVYLKGWQANAAEAYLFLPDY